MNSQRRMFSKRTMVCLVSACVLAALVLVTQRGASAFAGGGARGLAGCERAGADGGKYEDAERREAEGDYGRADSGRGCGRGRTGAGGGEIWISRGRRR